MVIRRMPAIGLYEMGVCACLVRAPILRSCGMCPNDNIRILSFGSSRRCRDVYLSRYRFLRLLILGFCTYPWALSKCVYTKRSNSKQRAERESKAYTTLRSHLCASHFKRPFHLRAWLMVWASCMARELRHHVLRRHVHPGHRPALTAVACGVEPT